MALFSVGPSSGHNYDPYIWAEGGYNQLSARTPARFHQRVLEQFRSPENVAYLQRLFAAKLAPGPLRNFALETLVDSLEDFHQADDLAYSDPLAQRGGSRPAGNLWAEVKRLNLAFFEYRSQFLRDKAALITGQTSDGLADDDESYHFRMFIADSLRPPGMEHLNSDGPLFALLEDQVENPVPTVPSQYVWENTRPCAARNTGARKEGMVGRAPGSCDYSTTLAPADGRRNAQYSARVSASGSPGNIAMPTTTSIPMPGLDPEDWGWDGGKPNRTAEEAIAQYWGDGAVATPHYPVMTALGATESGGPTYGDRTGWGAQWRENGGTRFMRYEKIPVWQNLSRGREYERDIRDTLGSGTIEFDSQVRGWDMDRMREPRGEEYRRYGPRSSSTGPS